MSPSERRGRWRRRLTVFFGTVLGLFLVAEVSLRVAGKSYSVPPLRFRMVNHLELNADAPDRQFQPSETLLWELRPGAVEPAQGDTINSHGLRSPEIALEKPDGTLRIALLGDSCTYGVWVDVEETFGALLAEGLMDRVEGLVVEWINGGVPGYTLHQGAQLYEERIRRFQPDVLVLYHGVWNDYNPAMQGTDREILDGRAGPSNVQRLHRFLQFSRVYQAIAVRYASALRYRHWKGKIDEWLAGEPSVGYRVPLERFRELLEEVAAACVEDGTEVVVLLPELNEEKRDDHGRNFERVERYRGALAEVAGAHGFAVVDTRALFPADQHGELFLDLMHPAAAGHARIAEALVDAILRAGWARPPG